MTTSANRPRLPAPPQLHNEGDRSRATKVRHLHPLRTGPRAGRNSLKRINLTARRANQRGCLLICLDVQPLLQKYFCFSEVQISLYPLPSRPTEGRCATSRTRGGMRWTSIALIDDRREGGRRS